MPGSAKSRWNSAPYASMIVSSRTMKAQKVKAWAHPDKGRLSSLRWAKTSTIWALIAPATFGRRSGGTGTPDQTSRVSQRARTAAAPIPRTVTARPAMRRAVTGAG